MNAENRRKHHAGRRGVLAPARIKWEGFLLLVVIFGAVVSGYKVRRKMLLANYIRMLRSKSEVVADEGVSKLAKLCPLAAPRLTAMAKNKSEQRIIRKYALRSLYDSGDDMCITMVTNVALAPGDWNLQWAVLEVLGESGDLKNLPSVRYVHLQSEFPDIRMKALRLYGRFLLEAIAGDLIKTMMDPDVAVAMEALHVLEKAARRDFGSFHDAMSPSRLRAAREDTARRARTWLKEYRKKRGMPVLPDNAGEK